MCLFFFFKQKTAYEMRISDWSSDVCSSDLLSVDQRKFRRWLAGWLWGLGGYTIGPYAGLLHDDVCTRRGPCAGHCCVSRGPKAWYWVPVVAALRARGASSRPAGRGAGSASLRRYSTVHL